MTKPAGLTAFILLSLVLLSSTDAAQTVLSFSDQNESASTPDFFRQQGEFAENTELNFERERESERERIETERHDFTQSTTVVGRGVTQVEFGYTFFQSSGEAEVEDSHATPELLLRFGLTEKVEFRLRYNQVWQFGEEDRSGAEDLHWAFKVRTSDQAGWRPESALEIRATAPTLSLIHI